MSYSGEGGVSVKKLIKCVASMVALIVKMGLYVLMGCGDADAAAINRK